MAVPRGSVVPPARRRRRARDGTRGVMGITAVGPLEPQVAVGGGGVHRGIVAVDVEQLRGGALLGLAHRHRAARHHPADLRVRIVEIAGEDRVLGAHHHARRLQPDVGAVGAVSCTSPPCATMDRCGSRRRGRPGCTPCSRCRRRSRSRRSRRPAGASPRWDRSAHRGGCCSGCHRVTWNDRRVLGYWPTSTYLTQVRYTHQGHLVLALARGAAGVAADAARVVDHEAVVHVALLGARRRWIGGGAATVVPTGEDRRGRCGGVECFKMMHRGVTG